MSRILALLFGIVGALGSSQAPEFTQQYMQNLTGRVDQLEIVVQRFDEDAMRSDMTREQALEVCIADERPTGTMSCKGRAEDVSDYQRLGGQLAVLRGSTEWERPIRLARNYDKRVLSSTMDEFKPAVPATVAGGGYALAGFALLWGIAAALIGVVTAPFNRDRY